MELKPCLQEQLDVEFQDVCYSVKIFKNYGKYIALKMLYCKYRARTAHWRLFPKTWRMVQDLCTNLKKAID